MVVVAKGLGRIMRRVCWGKCRDPCQKINCTDCVYSTYLLDSSNMRCVKHPHPNSLLCSSVSSFPHAIKLTTRRVVFPVRNDARRARSD